MANIVIERFLSRLLGCLKLAQALEKPSLKSAEHLASSGKMPNGGGRDVSTKKIREISAISGHLHRCALTLTLSIHPTKSVSIRAIRGFQIDAL
ncbi:MAG: hypothetical protein R3242_09100 [Akkermansiaceae bacterium]|nr:hypothetical protein [Akkermansiaceae bacterium]